MRRRGERVDRERGGIGRVAVGVALEREEGSRGARLTLFLILPKLPQLLRHNFPLVRKLEGRLMSNTAIGPSKLSFRPRSPLTRPRDCS